MIAYQKSWLENLLIVKESRRWADQHILSSEQLQEITKAHPSGLYHPNLFIRILLFIATLVALAGITGLSALLLDGALDDDTVLGVAMFFYGLLSISLLELLFIKNGHYKSGVNEAIIYHSIGWVVAGVAVLSDFNETAVVLAFLLLFTLSSIRYADLISTALAFFSFIYLVFDSLQAFESFRGVIPVVFIVVFTPGYFFIRDKRKGQDVFPWRDVLILAEVLSLVMVYLAGNYFVVRELSQEMLGLYLAEGEDIPFAVLFYILTVAVPLLYLYYGIKTKNIVLLRVSLAALAFSVFTFKYYFSLGHPEITLTLSGAVLLGMGIWLFKFLKTPRNGYTRENVLTEKWASANVEALIISQTLGGNKSPDTIAPHESGGRFGGGGSSDSF